MTPDKELSKVQCACGAEFYDATCFTAHYQQCPLALQNYDTQGGAKQKCTDCPECGCVEYNAEDQLGKGFRICNKCDQEWWTDVEYEDGALAERVEELESLFDLQQSRMEEATRVWQESTGNKGILPDLGQLLEWLLDERSRKINQVRYLRKQIKEVAARRDMAYGYGSDAGKPPWMD